MTNLVWPLSQVWFGLGIKESFYQFKLCEKKKKKKTFKVRVEHHLEKVFALHDIKRMIKQIIAFPPDT